MPTRRLLLAAPLLMAARPLPAAPWRGEVGELRLAGVDPHRMASRLGVPIRLVHTDLVRALDEGHLEAARLDPATAARASARMQERLALTPAGTHVIAVRRALPAGLQAALESALT